MPAERVRRLGLRWTPHAACTRIIGWVLLLVLLALAVVTLVTWRLLLRATDERMDITLGAEVYEFSTVVESGIDPQTRAPFISVTGVLETVITYDLARPNEKFLGYVEGEYRFQSRIEAPVLLSEDREFTELVGTVSETTAGRYDSEAGRCATSPSRSPWTATPGPPSPSSPTSPTRNARPRTTPPG